MPRGRPPKTAEAKKLQGNPGKRDAKVTKRPAAKAPPMPTWLSAEAKAQWKYTIEQLRELGTLSQTDQVILTVYCETWAEFRQIKEVLDRDGRYVTRAQTTSKGEVVGDETVNHPAQMDYWRALGRLRQYATDLGLTPASRGWVRTPPSGEAEDQDDFDDYLKGR